MTWQQKIVRPILGHRVVTLIAIAAVTAVSMFYASRVGFDNSIEIWFLKDDPNLIGYHDFLERFGADEVTVLGVFADDDRQAQTK